MNWLSYIHLDRRSKHSLITQLELGLIALMHEELVLHPGQKIASDELSKQLNLPIEDVLAVFQRLQAFDYLYQNKRSWFINDHFFHRYYFTRPFAIHTSTHTTPFQEVILDQGWMALPKAYARFVANPPSHVYHIREHFLHKGMDIGMSDSYYLLPKADVHHTPSASILASLRANFSSFDREVNLIPRTKTLSKLFHLNKPNPYFLQGRYGLYHQDHCVVCGTVTTLTSYSYRNRKKPLSLSTLF